MVKQLAKPAKDSRVKRKEVKEVEAVRADPSEFDALVDQLIKSKGAKARILTRKEVLNRGKLSLSDQKSITDIIVSSLMKIGDDDVRLGVFNEVASALGYVIAPASNPDVDPKAEPGSMLNRRPLPEVAPQLYRERPDAKETAEGFLRRVYEPWLAAGCLFQFHIGKLDPPLLQGLKNQFKGRAEELRAILPTKKDEVSQRLAALVGKEIDDPAQRRLLAQAERSLTYAMAKLKL